MTGFEGEALWETQAAVAEAEDYWNDFEAVDVPDYPDLTEEEIEWALWKLGQKDPQRLATPGQKQKAYQDQGGACYYCEVQVNPNRFHADHLVAHSKGGRTSTANIVCACVACNIAKWDMSYTDFKAALANPELGLTWRDQAYAQNSAYLRDQRKLEFGH
jgi:hypothetical protein